MKQYVRVCTLRVRGRTAAARELNARRRALASRPPRGHYWSTGTLISRIGRRGSRCAAPLVLRRIVDDLPARRACMHGGVRTTGLSTTSTYDDDDDWDDGAVRCLAVNLGDADTPPSSAPTRLYNGTDAPLKDFQTGRLKRAGTSPVRKSPALDRPSRARAWPGPVPCSCLGRGVGP